MSALFRLYCLKLLSSGLFWSAVVCLGIEARCLKTLPSRFFSHEVDMLLYDLQTRNYDAETLVLGDSVARQIALYLAAEGEADFLQLTTNGALQMAGQYYILQRYLERNRAPENVILLKHRPLHGNLNRPATENYVQRCFTRWHEIAEMTRYTGSPAFGLRALSYRMATAKYRLHLQELVPWLPAHAVVDDPERLNEPADGENPMRLPVRMLSPGQRISVSERYFLKMIDLCSRNNIRLGYLPCPMPDEQWKDYQTGPAHARLVARLGEISQAYPGLRYITEIKTYPADWFIDGVHVRKARLPRVAADYAQMMNEMMQP